MAPNITTATAMFLATTTDESQQLTARKNATATPVAQTTPASAPQKKPDYKWEIAWRNVIAFVYLHLGLLYAIYLAFTATKWQTLVFALLYLVASGLGVTAGAHRLWAHKTYKAKLPLRIILGIFQTMAFQNHIYEWVRDHRVHHKFTDTDADPHNASRGFFFSHIGWLMVKKHKDVKEKGKAIPMDDLEEDIVVVWQRKTYLFIMPLLCFVLPWYIPVYFWGENGWVSWYVAAVGRYTLNLNGTWLVNSAAHLWGMKPFDKSIGPVENFTVSALGLGEGWHNYHHTFPWDYKTGELGNYRTNLTAAFIDFFALIGWAYDLKTVSAEHVRRRALRTGDGSWRGEGQGVEDQEEDDGDHHHPTGKDVVWGWGDKDMPEEDIKEVEIFNKKD